MGRPAKLVNEIVQGKRAITPETAVQIGEALGTGPEVWMNLESQYQLSKVYPTDDAVSRKSRLYSRFPVREMVKRGWIEATETVDALEQQFLQFFSLASLDDQIVFGHAAKRSSEDVTSQQYAWLFAARRICKQVVVPKYSADALLAALPHLHALLSAPEEVRHVPRLLNECGVRFVVVEALPSSKIDGACFWLEGEPAIAISTRQDRIDNFWFVVRHEIEHVLREHGKAETVIFDEDLSGVATEGRSKEEQEADTAGSGFCVQKAELDNYIARVQPYYFSEQKVLNFAARIGVHPGVVVGQLQNRFKGDSFKYLRSHLVKVREFLLQSAPHDGWGTAAK